MSAKLSRAEALRLAHEVAAWTAYEVEMGSFQRPPVKCYLTRTMWRVWPGLGGGCAIASYILACVLRARGVKCGVVQEWKRAHFVVSTECGLLIDPTASQFGKDGPTVVRPRKRHMRVDGAADWYLLNPDDNDEREHPSSPSHWLPVIARILRRMGVDAPFHVESEKVAA